MPATWLRESLTGLDNRLGDTSDAMRRAEDKVNNMRDRAGALEGMMERGQLTDQSDPRTAIEMVHGAPVYRLRGRLLPLVYLARELKLSAAADTQKQKEEAAVNIVVLQADGRQFGLVVDQIKASGYCTPAFKLLYGEIEARNALSSGTATLPYSATQELPAAICS